VTYSINTLPYLYERVGVTYTYLYAFIMASYLYAYLYALITLGLASGGHKDLTYWLNTLVTYWVGLFHTLPGSKVRKVRVKVDSSRAIKKGK